MALQTNGPINVQDIATEFGGVAPHALSEYYRGGGLVPNGPVQNAAIALSGAINVGSFYGGTNRIPITINITTNQNNYIFNTSKVSPFGYVAGISDVTFVIASGVALSATTTSNYGGHVDTSWAAGDTVRIESNGGFIVGCGGNAGAGGGGTMGSGQNGFAGAAGGPAFIAQRFITFNNNGTIGGGGGGGGGGAGAGNTDFENSVFLHAGGSGGGGGRSSATTNSNGGAPGVPNETGGIYNAVSGNAGSPGTFSTQGTGGAAKAHPTTSGMLSGAGGAGGNWGAGGGAGGQDSSQFQSGGAGGGAGTAIVGNGNISWLSTGTRLGAIT